MIRGMVTATGGGGYSVLLDEGEEVQAVLRGRLKLEARVGDRVVIGDRVLVVPVEAGAGEKGWAVERVEPRASQIVRRGPTDRRPKVIAANVDRMLAVVAARDPEPRLEQLDRLLVIAEANGIRPVILVNKTDLPGADAFVDRIRKTYREAGYRVVAVSAESGRGLEELRGLLGTGTSALVGASGVGKSSLLNALAPELELRTGELSRKVRRGRHTTVRARLIRLPSGGLVADTPGFGDVGVWGVSADEVEGCFPEVVQRREGCRFRGCAHVTEPGCAVLAAVEAGEVPESRWGSYVALREGV
ncbi:MAG: ribosome small subunit-dependent GTPase A [Gemmatimonadales bacterium]|nr:MAG: ribosome small subunit-dependent GTPase A [Gemmatimonadales bacterium]